MEVRIEKTPLEDAWIVSHEVFEDTRGFFMEVFRRDLFEQAGLPGEFVQLNHSRSAKGVLRGLHFQWEPPMAKLMRVIQGTAFLVAVDIRKGSPNLGKWFGVTLSQDSGKQLWAPAGFARGFGVLSDTAEIQYLCTGTYNAAGESGIRWNDPDIGIEWPVKDSTLSEKDRTAQSFSQWLASEQSDCFRYDR